MKTILALTLALSFSYLAAPEIYAQDTTKKYSAQDLISDYYDEDFRPFSRDVWLTKLSFSLSDKQLNNVARLFDRVVEGSEFSFNLGLSAGKYYSKYFLVGIGLGFNESKFVGTIIDSNSDTINAQSISRTTTIIPFTRISIPLSKSQRLSLYNDIGMSFGFGNSLTRDVQNQDEIIQDKGRQFVFGIGLSPGVTFFVVENFAFEVGINLIGYQLNVENATDQTGVESRRVEHDVNFQVNLLSLNLGVAYFIGTKK